MTTTRFAKPTLGAWDRLQTLLGAYVPLRYVHLTKTPHKRFIRDAWLKDDLYVVLLAFSFAGWILPFRSMGIALLTVALWTIYEIGYHENDTLGAAREADPILPHNFADVRDSVPSLAPWLWSLAATIFAAPFIVFGDGRATSDLLVVVSVWMAVLVAIRLTFATFNRLAKKHRVIPHLLLQIGKYFGYAALVTLTLTGAALLAAQVAFRWLPYVTYRWGKSKEFPTQPLHRTRLVVFLALGTPTLLLNPSTWQFVLFGVASALLGRRALRAAGQRRTHMQNTELAT